MHSMNEEKPPDTTTTEQTPEPAPPPRTIRQEMDLFAKRIDALTDTLPLAMLAISQAADSSSKELRTFLEKECTKKPGETKNSTTYDVPADKFRVARRLFGRLHKTTMANTLVPQSVLVSLVSQYDAFLGKLIRHLFLLKPDTLNASGHSITFGQLTSFASIEEAREYVIEKEVETVLRKSHSEQFDWLENKFGLQLRINLPAWQPFIELTERRNLFVHADGIVTRQYIEACERHSCKLDAEIRIGKQLSVDRQYFENAHECVFEIGIKLAQVLWRKVSPENLEKADSALVSIIYDLLSEGRYRLARVLSDFAVGLPRHSSEEHRLTMVINRAQAYKWSGDENKVAEIVGEEDWTASSVKFRLAQAVLLNRFDDAIRIMKEMGKAGEVSKLEYRDWPLFKEVRKMESFQDAFQEIFGEQVNTLTVPAEAVKPAGGKLIN